VSFTAYRMLRDFCEWDWMRAGEEWVIQNGANSGVGRAAIQLGREWSRKLPLSISSSVITTVAPKSRSSCLRASVSSGVFANSGVGRAAIQLGREWGIKTLNVIRQRKTPEETEALKQELGAVLDHPFLTGAHPIPFTEIPEHAVRCDGVDADLNVIRQRKTPEETEALKQELRDLGATVVITEEETSTWLRRSPCANQGPKSLPER
jgi:NADPH:quinone reductase-like Zn-dependent oxidoreductase